MIEIGPNLAKALSDIALASIVIVFIICWLKMMRVVKSNEIDKIKEPSMYTYKKTITKNDK